MPSTPCLAFGPDGARCVLTVHGPDEPHCGYSYPHGPDLPEADEWRDGLRLDLGSGPHPAGTRPEDTEPGAPFIGVDRHKYLGVDYDPTAVVDVDLFQFPWPWHDGTVDAIWCSHFIEHLPPNTYDRATGQAWYPVLDFLAEVDRVLKPGGQIVLTWPSVKSERAFMDPTHNHFMPIPMVLYANREWRQTNGLDRAPYPTTADLTLVSIDMGEVHVRFKERHPEFIAQAAEHYWEGFGDIRATLRKGPLPDTATQADDSPVVPVMSTLGVHTGG